MQVDGSTTTSWFHRNAICGLALALCILPFCVSAVPPMTDVSQHVLVARVVAAYDDPALEFDEHFAIDWSIAPGVLFYVLLSSLQRLVGPYREVQVLLTGWVVATFLSVLWFARVLGQRDPWIPALVVLPLTFCWYVYMGLLPFVMTFPLFAAAMAVWSGRSGPTAKIPAVWVLLVLSFGFHVVGAAATAAAIVVVAIVQAVVAKNERRVLMEAGLAVLPVPVLVGVYFFGRNSPNTDVVYTNPLANVLDAVKFTVMTLNDVSALLLALWVVGLTSLLLITWRDLFARLSVLAAAASLVLLAILMPSDMGALWPAGPRLIPYALVLACACVPWSRFSRFAVVGGCILVLSGLCGFTVRHAYSLGSGFAEFLSGIDVIEPGSTILPVLANPGEGSKWVSPYWSLASAYTVFLGGSNPYVFAAPYVQTGASPLRYLNPERDRRFAFLYGEGKVPEDYRGVSELYDYVLVWRGASALERVLSDEMQVVHRRGGLIVFSGSRSERADPDMGRESRSAEGRPFTESSDPVRWRTAGSRPGAPRPGTPPGFAPPGAVRPRSTPPGAARSKS